MPGILYGVSPIGLGHASRAAAVGLKLRSVGLEPVFATGGNAASFLASYGFKVHSIVTAPVPSERNGEMRYPALWYIRYWRGYRSTRFRMVSLIDDMKPDLIVGDEEFSCISTAIERGTKHSLISDELELGFARSRLSRYVEGKVARWYADLQRRTSSILVPDFGEDHGNLHFVSPVVREVTRSRTQIRDALGIGPDVRLVLLSASGSGIGEHLLSRLKVALESLKLQGVALVVTGLPRRQQEDGVRYLGVERDNQDFVAAADLVVSTAGKSTIDEAACFGSPIIAVPIKNHYEQEQNASTLGFAADDLYRLEELVPEYLGHRSEPKEYRGAEAITAYLQKLL